MLREAMEWVARLGMGILQGGVVGPVDMDF